MKNPVISKKYKAKAFEAEIEYYSTGDGELNFLVIPGIGESFQKLLYQIDVLSRFGGVYAFNRPKIGDSTGSFKYNERSHILIDEFITYVINDKRNSLVIVANSFGGNLTLKYLQEHSISTASAILFCPLVAPRPNNWVSYIIATKRIGSHNSKMLASRKDHPVMDDYKGITDIYGRYLAIMQGIRVGKYWEQYGEMKHSVSSPVTAIFSEPDYFLDLPLSKSILEHIVKNVSIIRVDGYGHSLLWSLELENFEGLVREHISNFVTN
ncbi:MAG: alpha/beta hydrolase [Candidatus Dojkabacteria bacterium]